MSQWSSCPSGVNNLSPRKVGYCRLRVIELASRECSLRALAQKNSMESGMVR
jgi:hypothetical protein